MAGARQFNQSNSEYLVTSATPITGAPFTMSCWFNASDATTRYTLMSLADSGTDNQYFWLRIDGNSAGDPVTYVAAAGSAASAVTSSGFTAGTWHHACAVERGAADREVYIDGGNSGTDTTSLTPSGIDRIGIGALVRSSIVVYYSGAAAHPAMWDVALSVDEVAALAKGTSPLLVRPSSLAFYAPLQRDSGDDFDIVGGLTLTDTNTVTSAAGPPKLIHPRSGYANPTLTVAAPATGGLTHQLPLAGVG